jgi:carbamoyl-phosphate synthase large subunit
MKSVGEAMGIGRCFAESLQKALRSLEAGLSGLDEVLIVAEDAEQRAKIITEKMKIAVPNRILLIAQAMREGISLEKIHEVTFYDLWFLEQMKMIIDAESEVRKHGLPRDFNAMLALKKMGFADKRCC